MKVCPSCSATINDDADFCCYCGYSSDNNKRKEQQTTPEVTSGGDYSPVAPVPPPAPPTTPPMSQVPPKQSNQKKRNLLKIVLIAFFGILILIVIVGMLGNLIDSPDIDNDEVVESVYQSVEETDRVEETIAETTTVEITTEVVETTAPVKTGIAYAYETFFDFYNSYLSAINSLDSSLIGYCTSEIKAEMIERFQYNKKSLFDLSRIDFDETSVAERSNNGYNQYEFYVKCVSKMYDRETMKEKEINYAVWKVTVTEIGNGYVVSKMERDDKYKMGTAITTYDDSVSIF